MSQDKKENDWTGTMPRKTVLLFAAGVGVLTVDALLLVQVVHAPDLPGTEEIKAAIKAAAWRWLTATAAGKAAWEASCEDFNIGDLVNVIGAERELREALAAAGVFEIEVLGSGTNLEVLAHDAVLTEG